MKKALSILIVVVVLSTMIFGQNPAGMAMIVDGDSDYVFIGNHPEMHIRGDITVEAWVNIKAYPDFVFPFAQIVQQIGDGELESQNTLYTLAITGDSLVDCFHEHDAGINNTIFSNGAVGPNEWVHLANVRDSEAMTYTVYINGILDTVAPYVANATGGEDSELFIGSNGSLHFNGLIDEVRIWESVRTQAQIQATMSDTLGPEYYASADSNLAGYWRLDQLEDLGVNSDGADDVRDLSVNANHGDLVGDASLLYVIPCEDITTLQARCLQTGTMQMRINLLNSTEYAGETVIFDVDGTDYFVVMGTNGTHSRASLQISGQAVGDHTITVEAPAGCFEPLIVNCPAATTDQADRASSLESSDIPRQLELAPNYPNPFNPTTEIRYGLPSSGDVSIKVFNILGSEVMTLANGYQEAGYHTVQWNGRDASGQRVASGTYVYQIISGNHSLTRMMLMAK